MQGNAPGRMGAEMSGLIHIGFGNLVNAARIVAVVNYETSPVKRMVQNAKEQGTAVDATQGRKTKTVMVLDSGQIVLSALLPETIAGRVAAEADFVSDKESAEDEA